MQSSPNNDINDAAIRTPQKSISRLQGKTIDQQQERKKLIIELKNLIDAFTHKEKIGVAKYFNSP